MTARSATKPTIITIINGGRYVGCPLPRFNCYEAYDGADRSIGTFETAALARDALLRSRAA